MTAHATNVIRRTDNHHGYPWKALCLCGWESPSYVAAHAAESMAADHLKENR